MTVHALPGLGLTGGWLRGADYKDGMDLNLLILSAATQLAVESRTSALPGSPTDGMIYIVPAADGTNPNKVAVRDAGAWTYVTPKTGWEAWVKDEGVKYRFTSGAWSAVAAAVLTRPLSFFFTTAPVSGEVLALYTACENITLADDFAGSVADVGTNPATSFVLDVQKNGTSVGTITISTGGSVTFVTTGTTVSLVAGDQLKIVAPVAADGSIANVSVTLKGSL